MKTSSKWLVSVLVVLGIASYWYYQEQSCSLLTIHVIRSGMTNDNKEGVLHGSSEIALSLQGQEEARSMAKQLASSSVRELYSSPVRRAHQTAVMMGADLHVPVIVDDRLKERSFGKAEGLPAANLKKFTKKNQHHGVEPLRDHVARLLSFFKEMAQRHKAEVYIVGHGAMVNSLLEYLELSTHADTPINHCSMHTFVYNPCSGHVTYEGARERLDRF